MRLSRELVEEALDAADVPRDVLHEDYSGRAMFGERCPALYLDAVTDVFRFFAALGAALQKEEQHEDNVDAYDAVELAGTTRQDQLGRGVVVYWPGLELV